MLLAKDGIRSKTHNQDQRDWNERPFHRDTFLSQIINRDFLFDFIDCALAPYTSHHTQALHPLAMALVVNSGLSPVRICHSATKAGISPLFRRTSVALFSLPSPVLTSRPQPRPRLPSLACPRRPPSVVRIRRLVHGSVVPSGHDSNESVLFTDHQRERPVLAIIMPQWHADAGRSPDGL